jgi:hypothetical protein
MQDGKIRMGSPGSAIGSPSTPGPAGMRGSKRPLDPSTPLGMANKRQRNGSGLVNEMTTSMSKPPIPYQFIEVQDKLVVGDYLTVLRRQVRRGGPLKSQMERKYQEALVTEALMEDERWKKENAGLGTSTIGGGPNDL